MFQNRVQLSGEDSGFTLKPYYMDEYTLGDEHQVGRTIGLGVRFIARDWGNLIDDLHTFDAAGFRAEIFSISDRQENRDRATSYGAIQRQTPTAPTHCQLR